MPAAFCVASASDKRTHPSPWTFAIGYGFSLTVPGKGVP